MIKHFTFLGWGLLLSCFPILLNAQDSTKTFSLSLDGFIESYYAYDMGQPAGNRRPANMYNHARHNELTVNFALLQFGVESNRYRAKMGLQAGTFPQYNWAHEPGMLQHLFEASVGLKLWAKQGQQLWLDAGVFPSHLGFADAKVINNWTLSRPLSAEESPYYLSGAKLTYQPSSEWELMLVICNGWQNIAETPDNSNKALGLQAVYRPNELLSVNYSNFFGNEMPDSAKQYRFFNNLFAHITPSEQFGLILGLDYGMQQDSTQNNWNNWLVASLVGHYAFNDHWELALRAEYMKDREGTINSFGQNDLNLVGTALNLNYKFSPEAQLRVEAKYMNSMNGTAYLDKDGVATNQNLSFTLSAAVAFGYQKEHFKTID